MQRTGDGQTQVGYSVAGRSRGRVSYVRSTPCTRRREARVSWFSHKTKVDSFSRFDLKIGGYSSCALASKPLARVFRFEHQNQ
jgi:hypothetical protein